jgi:hypothetical protein
MEISSVFTVTDFKTGKSYSEEIQGSGQEPIKFLRGKYPKFSKFVLEGFSIDGNFKYVDLR